MLSTTRIYNPEALRPPQPRARGFAHLSSVWSVFFSVQGTGQAVKKDPSHPKKDGTQLSYYSEQGGIWFKSFVSEGDSVLLYVLCYHSLYVFLS